MITLYLRELKCSIVLVKDHSHYMGVQRCRVFPRAKSFEEFSNEVARTKTLMILRSLQVMFHDMSKDCVRSVVYVPLRLMGI